MGDDGFDEFDEIDDDYLRTLPLDFPCDEEPSKIPESQITSTNHNESSVHKSVDINIPDDFPFPFNPYDIQVGFMKSLYKALESGDIGIFESPTGTGKSLSLICGALKWLKDNEKRQKEELEKLLGDQDREEQNKAQSTKPKTNDGELDWVSAFVQKKEQDEAAKKLKEEQEARLKREKRLEELKKVLKPSKSYKRKRNTLEDEFDELFQDASKELKEQINTDLEITSSDHLEDDENIVVAEYFSDEENGKKNYDSSDEEDLENQSDHITKIYFCSRTHSQLSQFVREVRRSPYSENTRVISLGSRQNLCINEAVKKLASVTLMNDRCLEMQKNKTKATKKKTGESVSKKKKTSGACPYYKQDNMIAFRDQSLVEVRDIESLVALGKSTKGCPYYGTRYAVPTAELVVLPYNILLHKSTRESCGIKIKDNIVIVDEAHNLLETINNIHSIEVTGAQISRAFSQLSQYMEKYRSRLKAKNLMYIKQILHILTSFIKALGGKAGLEASKQKLQKTETQIQTINDFLFNSELDNLNLFKVMKYCERSLISRKLHGFVEKYQPAEIPIEKEKKKVQPPTWALSNFLKEIGQGQKTNQETVDPVKLEVAREQIQSSFNSPLMHIEGFLEALTNANKDGRIVLNRQGLLSHSSLKFLLLNPAVHFTELVSEARSVIVAGGTMQPLSEFKEQLFFAAGAKAERILEYSCGHVIPAENLLPMALARGSSGKELDFTYQSRNSTHMMDELGRVVYNVCNLVPGGVVCFFPSYEYERVVHEHWEKTGFLQKICAKNRVFREPKQANQVDQVLGDYSRCIKRGLTSNVSIMNGAILFCVVGGKMSEGINFSDDLGRCIIMVGLPYPNLRSPELKEKMDYLNSTHPKSPDGRLPGQIHYENLCMKAVNQSIGRAIRHKEDYATILLLDHRYLKPSMRLKLPEWIGKHLKCMDRFGPTIAALKKFFSAKGNPNIV